MTHASLLPAWTTPPLRKLGSVYVLGGDRPGEVLVEGFCAATGSLREGMGVTGFHPAKILEPNLKEGEKTC